MDNAALDGLFTFLLRSPQVFAEARTAIVREHFYPQEVGYAFLWYLIEQGMSRNGAVSQWTLSQTAMSVLAHSSSPPPQHVLDAIFANNEGGLLFRAFMVPQQQLITAYGMDLLRAFLNERGVNNPMRRLAAKLQNGNIADMQPVLTDLLTQARRANTLSTIPAANVIPVRGTPLMEMKPATRTGWNPVDHPFGGQRKQDFNGLLGVTGGGKTTSGLTLAVSRQKVLATEYARTNVLPGLVIYVSYEQPQHEILPMIWSNAASIRREKLARMRDWEELTTRDNLEQYEQRLFASGAEIPCERERYDMMRFWMGVGFEVLDMSGSAEFPNAGRGFTPELRTALERLAESRGREIDTVVVDWAGLICDRYAGVDLTSDNGPKKHTLLTQLGEGMFTMTKQLDCTIWLTHQLKGEAGKMSPTALMHHSDSADGKALANLMALCGCIGTEHKASGCRRLNWSKTRYIAQDIKVSPFTLKVHEEFCRMEDVTARYTMDEVSRQFVPAMELSTVRTLGAIRNGGPSA